MTEQRRRLPSPICFRTVELADLPKAASWFGRGLVSGETMSVTILESLYFLYEDEDWRRHTIIMTAGGRAILMIEFIEGELHVNMRPEVAASAGLSVLAWELLLRYFLENQRMGKAKIVIAADRIHDIRALQRIGCRRLMNFTDSTGTYRRYVCRIKDLRRLPPTDDDE